MRDYLLTNERLAPTLRNAATWSLPPVAAQVLYGVRPEFLEAALDEIETNRGGMEAYLREGLGLRDRERARLRELYLQG
jgi:protein-tyrosine phosphatase